MDLARLARRLERILDASVDTHAFSGVVSVRQQDRVLYERAAGLADRSNVIANTRDTRFGIASGTKFFTALAIGKLLAADRLSFETRLSDCLTLDLRYAPDITVRHLLTHTSGIPDFYDEEEITDFENFRVDRPWYELEGPRDYLAVFPDRAMKFAPGERFSYSNGGYILLGVVIEEVTGVPYREYVEQAIFEATGMHESGFFAFDRLPARTALGYIEDAGGWRTNIYSLPIIGASDGGAYTTAHDLTVLWEAFWGDEILPRELVEIYASPQISAAEGTDLHYGHGLWIHGGSTERPEFYITGADAGVSFWSSFERGIDREVTVLSNTTDGAWPILQDLHEVLRA